MDDTHLDYTHPELLWSPETLRDRIDEPDLVILDMRPPEEFSNGHVPGASSFDIFGMSLIDTRPEPLAAFLWMVEHLIGGKGVSSQSRVLVYDRVSGERAARIFWFLELFGHPKIHLLNGGFQAWEAGLNPVTERAVLPRRADFKAVIQYDRLATADDVLNRIGHPETTILDVRSGPEHDGTLVRSKRGGRIPGALHLEWKNNLDADGTFKSGQALREQYELLGLKPTSEIIPYCQGGYRSANTYLALRLIGYPRVRNYLGSWGEWGNREGLPIENP